MTHEGKPYDFRFDFFRARRAFFAGFAPVRDPELVAVVMINDPAGDANGGGSVAAPVFGRVMSGAMRILKVAPDQQVAMGKGGGDAHG